MLHFCVNTKTEWGQGGGGGGGGRLKRKAEMRRFMLGLVSVFCEARTRGEGEEYSCLRLLLCVFKGRVT